MATSVLFNLILSIVLKFHNNTGITNTILVLQSQLFNPPRTQGDRDYPSEASGVVCGVHAGNIIAVRCGSNGVVVSGGMVL